MSRHLDELWSPIASYGSTTARGDRLPSPSRKAQRAELERDTAVQERAQKVARQSLCVIPAHTHPIRSICIGPHYAYTAGMDGLIKVWQFDTLLDVQGSKARPPVALQEITAHSAGVSCLCIVDNKVMCSGGWDSTAKVWDLATGHTCRATLKGHSEFVRAVAGDAGKLYTGSNDRTIRVWDLETFQCVGMMAGHSLAVISLAVANDKLFSGGYDLIVRVWDTKSHLFLMEMGGHQQVITNLSVGRATRVNKETGDLYEHLTVYSCAEDNMVYIWDPQSLTCKGQLQLEIPSPHSNTQTSSPAHSVGNNGGNCTLLSAPPSLGESRPFVTCQGPDGVLYVGDRGGSVQQWDLDSNLCVGLHSGHTASVRALAVLHHVPFAESLILSGSDDGTIRVWKNSNLVAGEKEGIRQDSERRTQEEHEAKRRAKESVELERQRQKNELAKMKAAEDESIARGSLQRVAPVGMQSGNSLFQTSAHRADGVEVSEISGGEGAQRPSSPRPLESDGCGFLWIFPGARSPSLLLSVLFTVEQAWISQDPGRSKKN